MSKKQSKIQKAVADCLQSAEDAGMVRGAIHFNVDTGTVAIIGPTSNGKASVMKFGDGPLNDIMMKGRRTKEETKQLIEELLGMDLPQSSIAQWLEISQAQVSLIHRSR